MRRITIGALAAGALLLAGAPAATAIPFAGDCPAGFVTWEVDLTDDTYEVDHFVDQEGNGDGIVCARALGQGFNRQYGLPLDFVVYLFVDNGGGE